MNRDDPTSLPESDKGVPSKGSNRRMMTPLAGDFEPGQDDVVCGRSKKCYNHVGNERFRQRVVAMLDQYSRAKSRLDKSDVLSIVVDQVRRASPAGGFVKQDYTGKWYEVGDFLARERTSQAFRDALHDRYKSSNISKKKKRQKKAKASDMVQQITCSEQEISARFERQSQELAQGGSHSQALTDNETNLDMIASRLNKLAAIPQQQSSPFSARGTSHPGSTQQLPFSGPPFGENLGLRNTSPAPSITLNETALSLRFAEDIALPRRSSSYSYPPTAAQKNPTNVASDEVTDHSMPNLHCGDPPSSKPHLELRTGIDYFDNAQQDVQHCTAGAAAVSPLNQRMEEDPMRVEREDHGKHLIASGDIDNLKSPPPAASLKEEPPSLQDPPDKDLLACLEKLTEHSIADGNPFEPMPLAEIMSFPPISPIPLQTTFQLSSPPQDDGSHHEFAEGEHAKCGNRKWHDN